jgi:hypothetical protein
LLKTTSIRKAMETPQNKKTKLTHDTLTACSSSGQHTAVAEKQDVSTLIDIAALQSNSKKERKIRSAGNNAIRGGGTG